MLFRRRFACLEKTADAKVGRVVSLSAVVTRAATGKTEDMGVIAFDHPDKRLIRLWGTSRRARGLPVGQIPPTEHP